MRIGNLDGRLVILTGGTDGGGAAARDGGAAGGGAAARDGGAIDVERASGGVFGADPQAIYARWAEFAAWARGADASLAEPFEERRLGAPAPAPGQSFGIGLNYREHARESGLPVPDQPSVFTKFPSCITGPHTDVVLPPGGHTDWEVELVAVIGARAHRVAAADGWRHVAGLTVGQDISERIIQLGGKPPQFSMGKSYPGFGPTGPCLVTPDELADPDDLELGCSINGDQMQKARTSQLIISVPELVAGLSAVLPLLPGDVIFTGTPSGVGLGRDPQRWLAPGDELVSYVEGIGELRQRFVASP